MYSVVQAVDLARETKDDVVFFATAGADLDVATSVACMRRAIDGTSLAESGHFVDHAGAAIPW